MDGRTLQIDTKITLTMRRRLCETVADKLKILAFISDLQEIITLMIFVIERQYFALTGARGGVVVKALRYKPAGRGFDRNFSVT
jgi:hypothetical protein